MMILCEVQDSCLSASIAMLERSVFSILRDRMNTSVYQKDQSNPCCIMKNKYQMKYVVILSHPYRCLRTRMLPFVSKGKTHLLL